MTHYSIAPYGNNKFEVQDLITEDPYNVVKGRYDTYESAAEAVKVLANRQVLNLACCCCGSSAPAFAQWYNRDKGYGLCNKCADWISKKEDAATMLSYYGHKGIHYGVTI